MNRKDARGKRGPKTVTVKVTYQDGTPGADPEEVRLRPGDRVRFVRAKQDWEVDVDLGGAQSPFRYGQRRFRPGQGDGTVRMGAPPGRFPYCVTVGGVSMDPDIVIEPDDPGGG